VPPKTPRLLLLALLPASLLYVYGLGSIGMLGPDEPRYAAIGRQMARSGDFITPTLWGQPWFEKPPLLYWTSAAAFRLGLPPDWAPRLPVALTALAFLAFFFWILRREFGPAAAVVSTLMLATTAGFWGFSQVGHMDLLLTCCFSAAMLLVLPWLSKGETRYLPYSAALLAFGVLAKALVPIVLAAPILLFARRRWRDLVRPKPVIIFAVIALPWYILCYLRNGAPFLMDLFYKQQFQRLTSGALQHVRPVWFYIPILLGLLAPWTPMLYLLLRRDGYRDPRRRFLLAIVLWGMLFFSVAPNKLPGYVLPLLPAIAALAGAAFADCTANRALLPACALLLVIFPVAVPLLPAAIASGLSHAPAAQFQALWLAPLAIAAAVALLQRRNAAAAVCVVSAGAAIGIFYLKLSAAPTIDAFATARPLWRQIAASRDQVCVHDAVDALDRGFRYGLNFYSGTPLPTCGADSKPLRILHSPSGPPYVSR